MMRNPEQTIGNIIDKQSTSLIGSIDANGFPNVKAMGAPRKRDGIKHIWYSTNTSSLRVAQFRENPNACVYFMDKRFKRGVQLLGTMEVLETHAAKEMLWLDGDTKFYSQGVTDPDYCVLKFTAQSGRYYSNYGSEEFEVTV